MKKRFDLDILENADKDTIETLSSKYSAVSEKEAEKLFQRITRNTCEPDEEIRVQGVEIYRRTIWKKALAAAMTLVIITGAAAGGAHLFAQHKNNRHESSSKKIYSEDSSIYEKLRANKDLYNMELSVWDEIIGEPYGKPDVDKEDFFGYMDDIDASEELSSEDFSPGSRSIRLFFNDTDSAAKGVTYNFELFDNGAFTWTENDNGKTNTTYHRFTGSNDAYHDIMRMYLDKDTIDSLEKVTRTELENLLSCGFPEVGDNKAFFYPGNTKNGIECTLSDKEGLKKELLELEWERADGFSSENSYYFGIRINQSGGMQIFYNEKDRNYKLKNEDMNGVLSSIIAKHLTLSEYGADVCKEEILDAFNKDFYGMNAEYRTDSGQFTNGTAYFINDYESLKDELSDLEWVTCKADEPLIYRDFYVAGAIISRNGYIHPQSSGTHLYSFKLKNESDAEKLRAICDKYMTADTLTEKASLDEIRDRINAGSSSFSSLKASFSLCYQPGSATLDVKGELICDKKHETVYMEGSGKLYGISPATDKAVFELCAKDNVIIEYSTESFLRKDYSPESGGGFQNYLYIDRTVLHYLEMISSESKEFDCRKRSSASGCTEYFVFPYGRKKANSDRYRIVLDEAGRVIAFSKGKGEDTGNDFPSFSLDEYGFDPLGFDSSAISQRFDDLNKRYEAAVPEEYR